MVERGRSEKMQFLHLHLPLEGTGKRSQLIFAILNEFGKEEGKNQRKFRFNTLEIIIFIRRQQNGAPSSGRAEFTYAHTKLSQNGASCLVNKLANAG